MKAFVERVLTLNLIATTVVFYVAAKIYLLPRLDRLSPRSVLIPIRLLHSLRQLGLMFLTRGATYPGLPWQFAYPAALGDFVTAVLAHLHFFASPRPDAGTDTSVDIQRVWHARLDRCDYSRNHLRRTCLYGTPLTGFPRFGFRHCRSRTM
jgi:hypothetical protein